MSRFPKTSAASALTLLPLMAAPATGAAELKPLPRGVFKSIGQLRSGSDDPLRSVALTPAVRGVIVGLPWDLCGDDQACLVAAAARALDSARERGLEVALAISDGPSVPPAVAAACQTVAFDFRGTPQRMCVAWDQTYLAAKVKLVRDLGAALDGHPALAYLYFTGACSTNGNEGHCHVDQAAYERAGYTAERLAGAYLTILGAYRDAFPTTPLAIELHALFDSAWVWERVWEEARPSGRVGLAAWWCAERLSVKGRDTAPIWPLVQEAASSSFSVCQTVASFTREPFRFSDPALGLDYGSEAAWTADDSARAFRETLDWAEGLAVHAGQAGPIQRFGVLEAWGQDADNPAFQQRIAGF